MSENVGHLHDVVAELRQLLRPAGAGLYVVSTGRAEQLAMQRILYGVNDSSNEDAESAITHAHHKDLQRIQDAKVIMLGIPSDVGAGYRRGANFGPQEIRSTLVSDPKWSDLRDKKGVVDLGDVRVIPQLLHDSMLSDSQIFTARAAMYPDCELSLPVSPLSIAERVLDLALSVNPKAIPLVLGGDHSTAWPVVASLAKVHPRFGIVQCDAHTDLLEERLGIRYCFATWSYHANDLIGRSGRMIQVGIRASRRSKEHWESTMDVRQHWAADCIANPEEVIETVVQQLHEAKIRKIYWSNDIDGTDGFYADATGTPEPNGPSPDFVHMLIRRLGHDFEIVGGDVMEVAPDLASSRDGRKRTLNLAAAYIRTTLESL